MFHPVRSNGSFAGVGSQPGVPGTRAATTPLRERGRRTNGDGNAERLQQLSTRQPATVEVIERGSQESLIGRSSRCPGRT